MTSALSLPAILPWLLLIALGTAGCIYLLHRQRQAGCERLAEVTAQRDAVLAEGAALRREKEELACRFAALTAQTEEERRAMGEKIHLLEQSEKRLAREFENVANRIFEEKQQQFSAASKVGLEGLLAPFQQQIIDFRRKVEEVHDSDNRERASLRTEINLLKTLNERIGADALNLTRALKGDSKARGNWGEMRLERLLDLSGLTRGREYEVQAPRRGDEGQRLQPDVIVHLPENKDVVIDAKVALVAYEAYHATEDEEERRRLLRAHVTALRAHIDGLGVKNYADLTGLNSLDMVILFVSVEPALLLALETEPGLYQEAFDRRILLVCPSTLMATLQIIYTIWRYEYQNRNAMTIAIEAGRLHDHFVLFGEALLKVGDQLSKATASYETAMKRLTSGRGNLVARARRLQELGARAKKSLPGELAAAENAEDNGGAEELPYP